MGPAAAERRLPNTFGEEATGDHFIRRSKLGGADADDGDSMFVGAENGQAIKDRATDFLGVYPQAQRTAQATFNDFRDVAGKQTRQIKSFYSGNAKELTSAAKQDWAERSHRYAW